MTDENKCAHKMCMCAKATNSDYCSSYCEDADDQDLTAIRCECGHSGCE